MQQCDVLKHVTADLLVRACVTYICTVTEYNSVVWSPDLKRDIEAIEKVQRRFTKKARWTEGTTLWPKIEICPALN